MSKKRANGEGSVYKTKDGRVIGSWTDANDKTRYMTSKTMTKRETSKAIRKKLQDRDEVIAADSQGLTLEQCMDRWLESIKDRVRPGTFKPYEAITRLHIKPTLGTTKLDKLNAMQLEKLYAQKLKSGLSPRHVRYIHVTVRKALKRSGAFTLLNERDTVSLRWWCDNKWACSEPYLFPPSREARSRPYHGIKAYGTSSR